MHIDKSDESALDVSTDPGFLVELIRTGAALAMVFGGVFPFVPQYLTIKRTGSAEGFSLYVCLTLLVANILRIIFWFGKRFEFPLLLQSIIMIGVMMVLVHAAVNCAASKRRFLDSPKHFRDMDAAYFWNWGEYRSYVECVVMMTIGFGLFAYGLISIDPTYIEIVGFLAVFIEACLGVPQFVRNCKKRSTLGMSVAMVAMWTCGDTFKTVYFYLRQAPVQFFMCGALQIVIDISILLQIVVFRGESGVGVSLHSPASSHSPSWAARDKQISKSII